MEEALRTLLVGNAPLAALVSTRIYWNVIAQSAASPAVVMYVISAAPGYHMQGDDRLTSSRVQIDIRATTIASAWAVSRAVKALLSGYRGTVSTTKFGGIFLLSERQRYDKPANSSEGFHMVSLDFDVWSRPTS